MLELERLFEKRYMAGFGDSGTDEEVQFIWEQVREHVTRASNLTSFDVAVNVALDKPRAITDLHSKVGRVIKQAFRAHQWVEVDHHRSHARFLLSTTVPSRSR